MAWNVIGRNRILMAARLITAFVAAFSLLGYGSSRAQAFRLGLEDSGFEASAPSSEVQTADAALRITHASVIRVGVAWARVAPGGNSPPSGFSPSNPSDPHYRWSNLDYAVRAAAQHHKQVLFVIYDAPTWAEGSGTPGPGVSTGAWNPDISQYAAFINALAARYSGGFAGLPRVKYWEAWDEPNLPYWFSAPDPVSAYRALLNRAYAVLKAVHKDNLVFLGGVAPVKPNPQSFTPLDFTASVLCLRRVGTQFRADRSCHQRTNFDVLGIHSYTLGATPTKRAAIPGDVFPADMGEVQNLVRAEGRLHGGNHQIWVTEFVWFTNPPNPRFGDSDATAARYVAYSMYEMWKSGVSAVFWQSVVDLPASSSDTGRGLYYAPDQPKLVLQAFSFPVIASVGHGHGFVWGRAPVSRRVRVVVQHAIGGRWRTVASTRSGSDGVFLVGFGARGNGLYRAKVVRGPTSLAYNSRPIPPINTRPINFG
jgi:hypothetical protein